MNRRLMILLIVLLWTAAGCNMFAPPAANQTLAAERDALGTVVASARGTATPATDRLQVTAEAALTGIARSALQSTRISATLMALGTPFVDVRFITPQAPTAPAGFVASGSSAGQGGPPAVLPTIIGQGSAQGNATLMSVTVGPTPPPGAEVTAEPGGPEGPTLENGVITDRVGADDCAVGSVTDFAAASLGVYIVATARDLPAGSQLTARFLREGVEQIFYTWSPGFNIVEGCIWFYMPSGDVAFSGGNWSAQIELNGSMAVGPLPFTVGGDAMADTSG